MAHLNLRQICLAAPELEPVVDAVRDVFGVDVCYRDPNVAKYGLVNALFVFGHAFLEVVAPTRPDTTAGRFIDRTGGIGGYMAIFDCSDPEARRDRAEAMGVRVAHVLDYPGYWGIQLHPRDCRATMLEFDRTDGGHDLNGPYHPAGEHWQDFQRLDRVRGIPRIDVESSDPAGLAHHWSQLMSSPVHDEAGTPVLRFDLGSARMLSAPADTPERLRALQVQVADPSAVLAAARARGLRPDGEGFLLAGMRFEPVPFAG